MSAPQKLWQLGRRLLSLSLSNPRDLQHVLGVALYEAGQIQDPETDIRPLPAVSVEQLLTGGESRVTTQFFFNIPASISVLEAYSLALLMRRVQAREVFEFGTYKGVSTTQLALNLEPGGRVHTLDLPDEDDPEWQLEISKPSERQIASERGKGALIPEELRSRVEFLRQDSAKFDPAPFAGRMDLVFVDGAHSADYVRNDSDKGWRMLRSGGILVWHDFTPSHGDVVRCVRGGPFSASRIVGTALAFAVKP